MTSLVAPRTVEEIFNDYNKRRTGLLKALTDGPWCRGAV